MNSPAGPVRRASTEAGKRPWVRRYGHSCSGVSPPGGSAKEPSGEVSVMPQAWITGMPWRSWKAFISAGGQAEPPMTTIRRVEVS